MDTLSTQATGLQMSRAQYAKLPAPNQINIVLRVTSSKKAWKIFAVNPGDFIGWSVSDTSGVHCTAQWTALNGIQLFYLSQYENHISEMQTLAPGTVLNASIGALCDKVYPNDKFYLTAQLRVLPSTAEAGSPESAVGTVNFSSNSAIPLEASVSAPQ